MSERCDIFAKAFNAGVPDGAPAVAYQSFTGSAAAFAAVALAARDRGVVLAVTAGLPEADTLFADIEAIADEAGVRVLEFPPDMEDDKCSTAARLKVSAVLGAYMMRPYPLVIVSPVVALAGAVASSEAVRRAELDISLSLKPVANAHVSSFASIQKRLLAIGYERTVEVSSPGEFSVRGGVLDVWSPDSEKPIRAEFFGDEIESIRNFDPGTQMSVSKVDSAKIAPVSVPVDGVDDGDGVESAENDRMPLLSLLPANGTVLAIDHNSYPGEAEVIRSSGFRMVFVGDPAPQNVPTCPFVSSPLPGFAEQRVTDAMLVERVREALKGYLAAERRKGALVVEDDRLSGGFSCEGLVVVAKSDRVPGVRGRLSAAGARAKSASHSGGRISAAMDIEPGELVVHLDYGIGRFLGSTEVEVGGVRSEVFTIEYADGAKLHVPVAHAHLLSRYVGVKGEKVKLHRLDGRRWIREKADAQKAVADLAAALLETQARRAVVPGFSYDVEADGIGAFESAFPYEETPDQKKAIEDVKRDLASRKPMDRLICGDAGYGKTEVAMRAAFIAAMNGKQTALLAPTTVLAQQHYETFLARFEGTPVRIEAMSRFQSEDEKRGARARLASGAADIVIGTHALLSSKIQFHDLGLIIVDEEQRFGVRHKEYLKRLRATADVLTMSATPIPRTLYLSMTGARDMSVLKTPPRERVATETKIVRDSDATVKSAISRELARGGQVYYLHNRVITISRAERRIRSLFPDARVDVAHGQMPTSVLADKMRSFSEGRTDVLICTTIVESGLDITRANTIIVDRADCFGIAELYQLRGRVGRGARQGYAYFLLPSEGLIDSEARERLDALRKHSGNGSGYNLSLRDLELRGAGNLLGSEQSGHIAAIGFSLYCQLLRRTIAKMRGEAVPDVIDVSVNLDFIDFSPGTADPDSGASLPYDYVEEEAQRMDFHRRLAEVASVRDVARLRRELADRYGRLPPAAVRLVRLAEFRMRCAAKRVARLDVKGVKAIFYLQGSRDPSFVERLHGHTPDQKISSLFKIVDALSE